MKSMKFPLLLSIITNTSINNIKLESDDDLKKYSFIVDDMVADINLIGKENENEIQVDVIFSEKNKDLKKDKEITKGINELNLMLDEICEALAKSKKELLNVGK